MPVFKPKKPRVTICSHRFKAGKNFQPVSNPQAGGHLSATGGLIRLQQIDVLTFGVSL